MIILGGKMEAKFFLKKLILQNFATFKNQKIHFRPGLNTIIGETGSGKSLVLEGLHLILGGRADKKVVRKDTEYSLIEASFFCSDEQAIQFLAEEGFPVEGQEIIIKRLIYKNGVTKTYINHLSSTVQFLGLFSKRFIDIVGQFENQKLLSESYQLQLLDHYTKLGKDLTEYQKDYQLLKEISSRFDKLNHSQAQREQRLDYLNYQLLEIDKLSPSSQDEENLLKKKNLLVNIEKGQKLSFQVKDIFEGGEGRPGLLSQIKGLQTVISKNKDFFDYDLSEILILEDQLENLFREIEKKFDLNLDPEELDGVLERIDLYQKLKKKLGGTVESLLKAQIEFNSEKKELESLDCNVEELKIQMNHLVGELQKKAHKLHLKRLQSSKKLSQDLTAKIRDLKMYGATIKLEMNELNELNEYGSSKVAFVAETNPGEGYFKVKNIASGGELSRILLSVRQILSLCDSISIFLFDEIDTGIGGETAISIGKALKSVSLNGQVIAITHLPQIAQFADSLIIVEKVYQNLRTESSIREVNGALLGNEIQNMSPLAQ
jgi:DNA repair protein RecN (Recombination protein N)